MNFGLRTLLFVAAIVCFVIAIFSNKHSHDWLALGLICNVGAFLVADLGWDRRGTVTNRT
jgi:hypothetical protein